MAHINPYYIHGDLHDKGLKHFVAQLLEKDISSLTLQFIVEKVAGFLLEKSNSTASTDEAMIYSLLASSANRYENTPFSEILESADLSSKAIQLVRDLLAIDDTAEEKDKILTQIDQLEDKVFQSYLSDRERNLLLLATAIAHSSVKRWAEELANEKSFWKKISNKVKRLPWKADVEGAVTAAVDPASTVLFTTTPIAAGITVAKIVGTAIVTSAWRFITGGRKAAEDEAHEEKFKKLHEKRGPRLTFGEEDNG